MDDEDSGPESSDSTPNSPSADTLPAPALPQTLSEVENLSIPAVIQQAMSLVQACSSPVLSLTRSSGDQMLLDQLSGVCLLLVMKLQGLQQKATRRDDQVDERDDVITRILETHEKDYFEWKMREKQLLREIELLRNVSSSPDSSSDDDEEFDGERRNDTSDD